MKIKTLFSLSLLLTTSIGLFAQQNIVDTLQHDGLQRSYRLHLPTNYNVDANMPLVLNFHGYGSNAVQQEFYCEMNALADAENFVVAYPDGSIDPVGNTHFNVGFAGGSVVDDVGFASKLIDELIATYKLDSLRVYSTGMSNGGFMSYKLACELPNKIAAIASVTGSMMPAELEACQPMPIPVMQIHGTADATVPYDGGQFGVSIENLVNFWVTANNCNTTPIVTDIENTDTNDGCTAQLMVYPNGDFGNEVHFYKIQGGAHTWPDGFFTIGVTNRDFNASQVIWNFFKQYTNNYNAPTSNNTFAEAANFEAIPNPFDKELSINFGYGLPNGTIKLYDISGQMLLQQPMSQQNSVLDTQNLAAGIYFLQVSSNGKTATQKVVKQ